MESYFEESVYTIGARLRRFYKAGFGKTAVDYSLSPEGLRNRSDLLVENIRTIQKNYLRHDNVNILVASVSPENPVGRENRIVDDIRNSKIVSLLSNTEYLKFSVVSVYMHRHSESGNLIIYINIKNKHKIKNSGTTLSFVDFLKD